jgi:hypothetical protein
MHSLTHCDAVGAAAGRLRPTLPLALAVALSACDDGTVAPQVACPVASVAPASPVRGPAYTIQSVTAGDPPTLIDITAPVSGDLQFTMNVAAWLIPATGARLEMRSGLGDPSPTLASAVVPPPSAQGFASATIRLDTRLRDAAGRRLVPNGAQSLQIVLLAGQALPQGCAPVVMARQTFPANVQDP